MRRNGGGLLEEAVDLTGLFVKGGPVVQVKSPGGTKPQVLKSDSTAPLYTGPLVVVVDRLSASATEIVAGALQDYGRAIVAGDSSTHGKGTVQQLVPLSRFWGWGIGESERPAEQLKLTVQKFYRISGGSTQKKGVVPDIILPSPWDHAEIGESTLPNCLPYDVIEKADYPAVNNFAPLLPELFKRSQERVKQDIDFTYIMEDSSFRQKKLDEKKLSLNEAARRAEKDMLLKQLETRKKERLSRQEPKDHIWEISLDIARNDEPAKDLSATPTPTPTKVASDDGDYDLVDDSGLRDAQLDESINVLTDLTLLQPTGPLQTNPVATK
jgi:carboxyl-terminal processing protease